MNVVCFNYFASFFRLFGGFFVIVNVDYICIVYSSDFRYR